MCKCTYVRMYVPNIGIKILLYIIIKCILGEQILVYWYMIPYPTPVNPQLVKLTEWR